MKLRVAILITSLLASSCSKTIYDVDRVFGLIVGAPWTLSEASLPSVEQAGAPSKSFTWSIQGPLSRWFGSAHVGVSLFSGNVFQIVSFVDFEDFESCRHELAGIVNHLENLYGQDMDWNGQFQFLSSDGSRWLQLSPCSTDSKRTRYRIEIVLTDTDENRPVEAWFENHFKQDGGMT